MTLNGRHLAVTLRDSFLSLATIAAVFSATHSAQADPLDRAAAEISTLKGVATVSPVVAPDRMFVGINQVNEASRIGTQACQEVRRAGVTTPYRIILIDGVKASAGGDWQLLVDAECPARFNNR